MKNYFISHIQYGRGYRYRTYVPIRGPKMDPVSFVVFNLKVVQFFPYIEIPVFLSAKPFLITIIMLRFGLKIKIWNFFDQEFCNVSAYNYEAVGFILRGIQRTRHPLPHHLQRAQQAAPIN